MPTVPTGQMERELRKAYLQWLAGMPRHQDDLAGYIREFQARSTAIIAKEGGKAASLGALGDFPTPKLLELSPVADKVYDGMQQAAIKAGIATGLNSRDIAQQILNTGLGQSYRKLERLARTEVTNAYWKNTWDSTADLPAIVMVWGSEESKRTCDYCLSRDGLVVEDSSIRDHPNGRCTLIPTLRSRVEYKGTLRPDGSVYMDPAWTGKKEKTKGFAGPVTPEQVDPLSGKANPAALHQDAASVAKAPVKTTTVTVPPPKARFVKPEEDVKLGLPAGTLTKAETAAMENYTERGYVSINNALRGKETASAETKKYIKAMDSAFDKTSLPEDVKVIRSVHVDTFGGEAALKKLVGNVFQEDGYLSTTLADKALFNAAVTMEIDVPAGTKALFASPYGLFPNERELLLNRGAKLAITSVTKKAGKWLVKATIVP